MPKEEVRTLPCSIVKHRENGRPLAERCILEYVYLLATPAGHVQLQAVSHRQAFGLELIGLNKNGNVIFCHNLLI